MEASFAKHVERTSIVSVEAFFATAELGLKLYTVSMGSNTVLSAANFSAQVGRCACSAVFGHRVCCVQSAVQSSVSVEIRL